MKKSILYIYSDLNVGGIQTLIYRKSKWLIEHGYNVILLTSSKGIMHNSFESIGVNIITSNVFFTNSLGTKELINCFNEIIGAMNNQDKIDVVECFEPVNAHNGLIISKLFNAKLLVGVYHPKAFTTGFEIRNQSYLNLIKVLDESGSLVFMNEDVLVSHESFYNIKINNSSIIKLPVDQKETRPHFIHNECFVVVSIGRLVDFKKYVYGLISDFDEFYAINKNSRLEIIGDGNEKENIVKFAKTFQSYRDGKIIFLGTIPYSELDEYLYKASLVIGMGTSVLETSSAGIPSVIAPAYFQSNISNGYVFENDNVGDTKNNCSNTYRYYMDTLYNIDIEAYSEISKKCSDFVKNNYDINIIMEEWLEKMEVTKPIIVSEKLDSYIIEKPSRIVLKNIYRTIFGMLSKIRYFKK
ncbi:glycosyltransferase [Marinilactibacillus kalidii]|uniref:glycosyltransferase n=1 Tax=Marinilactibacillus kalidii TaxID=2820274 RepID=UPI001ABDC93F